MRIFVALSCMVLGGIAALAGCSSKSSSGSSSSDGGGDGGVVDSCAPIDSSCGQPCQEGNSLGVGHFCESENDCAHAGMASLCAVLGNASSHFCTFMCSPEDAGSADAGDAAPPFPTSCGEGAACTCSGSQCGCVPVACMKQLHQ